MITIDQFLRALTIAMRGRPLDAEQRSVVEFPIDQPLIVVAGAGSGKTTAITARALRMIFVERRDPASIVLTTFTKKAAAELGVQPTEQENALSQYDAVVREIEASVAGEVSSGSIVNSWPTRPIRDTCVACDFRTMSPDSLYRGPAVTPLGRPASQLQADED